MKKETRIQSPKGDLQVRASVDPESNEKTLEGYAILFNQRSKLIFEDDTIFNEVIERGALDSLLGRKEDLDVLYTFQHNMSEPMARYNPAKGVETLTFSVDEVGLKFRAVIADTQLGRDTFELVRSGVLYETSFIFTVDSEGQRWERDSDGLVRNITSITGLYDISTVVRAAYDGTSTKVAREDFSDMIPVDEARLQKEKDEAAEAKESGLKRQLTNDIKLKLHQIKK
jgi:HK97 family phage prohead protease